MKAEIFEMQGDKKVPDFKEYSHMNEFKVNNKIIRFPVSIGKKLELADKVIVSLYTNELKEKFPEIEYWRALFAFDFEGNMLWQVEPPFYILTGDRYTGEKIVYNHYEALKKDSRGSYTDSINSVLRSESTGKIVAWGRIGYELDPDTGKLLSIHTYER